MQPRHDNPDSRPCIRCGYDLTGTPASVPCPECGVSKTMRSEAIDGAAVAGRRSRLIGVIVAAAVPLAVIAWLLHIVANS